MSKKYLSLLIIFISILQLGFGCDKKDDTPVEPETTGVIKGQIIELNTNLPIENANVFTEPATEFVTTDLLGNFIITNVEPGTFDVNAEKDGFTPVKVSLNVTAGENSKANMILQRNDSGTNTAYGSISGTVKDAISEIPLENVVIITSPATNSVLSGLDGKYMIPNVTAGEFVVTAIKSNYDTSRINIQVVVGKDSKADFLLISSDSSNASKYGRIEGTVVNSVTGAPLKGITVTTTPALSAVTTDILGFYSIDNVLPGSYVVSAAQNGFETLTTQVTVIGAQTANADFSLKSIYGSIKGRIVDANLGQPVTGVNITTSPGTSSVTSDALGYFNILNVTAGTYSISASKTGFNTSTISVKVDAGFETTADITLINK